MADDPTYISPQRPRAVRGADGDSTVGLVRRLFDEVSTLFRQELDLATAEISRSLSAAKAGIGSMATGGAVAFAGFLVILEAIVLALAEVFVPWFAALIVGVVVAIIGYAMLRTGRKRVEPEAFTPTRTQESLRRDHELLKRRLS